MFTGYIVGLLSSLRFVDCGAQFCFGPLWIASIIHCVFVAAEGPWFGLQLSCFGHVRAKNNSKLPCGLEPCFIFGLGLSSVVFSSFTVL